MEETLAQLKGDQVQCRELAGKFRREYQELTRRIRVKEAFMRIRSEHEDVM